MILAIMKYILDTHALIWFLEGNSRLGVTAKEILADSSSELILPAIALAESVWIVSRGKTSIPSVDALLKVVKQDKRISIYPLDSEVIEKSINLFNAIRKGCSVEYSMNDDNIIHTTCRSRYCCILSPPSR